MFMITSCRTALPALLLAAVVITSASTAQAGNVRCSEQPVACKTTGKPVEESKSGWEDECECVCIPAVQFPWHCFGFGKKKECCDEACDPCGPTPRLGRVRVVKKLVSKKYKVNACEYEHHIVPGYPTCPLETGACAGPGD